MCHHKPSGTEIPRGWGVKIKKPSLGGKGGFGYFLELHKGKNSYTDFLGLKLAIGNFGEL